MALLAPVDDCWSVAGCGWWDCGGGRGGVTLLATVNDCLSVAGCGWWDCGGGGTGGCDLASDGGRLQQSGSPRPLRDERGSRQTHRHLAARVERVVQVLLKTHQRINEL